MNLTKMVECLNGKGGVLVWNKSREEGIDIRDGPNLGSGGSVGTKVKGGWGGGRDFYHGYENTYAGEYILHCNRYNNNILQQQGGGSLLQQPSIKQWTCHTSSYPRF